MSIDYISFFANIFPVKNFLSLYIYKMFTTAATPMSRHYTGPLSLPMQNRIDRLARIERSLRFYSQIFCSLMSGLNRFVSLSWSQLSHSFTGRLRFGKYLHSAISICHCNCGFIIIVYCYILSLFDFYIRVRIVSFCICHHAHRFTFMLFLLHPYKIGKLFIASLILVGYTATIYIFKRF